jgi:hypothetical protein
MTTLQEDGQCRQSALRVEAQEHPGSEFTNNKQLFGQRFDPCVNKLLIIK